MRKVLLASLMLAGMSLAAASRGDDYDLDDKHAGIVFKISHLGLSWTYGRFNDFSGSFQIDTAAPAKSSFAFNVKADSIDTGNAARDTHLRSPDFFNTKQFPLLSFKSTGVKPIDGGFDVTGDLSLHGVTKSVTFPMKGGAVKELKGVARTGYSADFAIKRSDFGMEKLVGPIGDEVYISVSFEGTKK